MQVQEIGGFLKTFLPREEYTAKYFDKSSIQSFCNYPAIHLIICQSKSALPNEVTDMLSQNVIWSLSMEPEEYTVTLHFSLPSVRNRNDASPTCFLLA